MKGYYCYLALAALCCIGYTPLATASEATDSTGRLLTASDSSHQSLKKVTPPRLRANRSNEHVNEITDKDRQLKGKRRSGRKKFSKSSTGMNKIKKDNSGKSGKSKSAKHSSSKGKGSHPTFNRFPEYGDISQIGNENDPNVTIDTDAPTQGPGSTNGELPQNRTGSEPSPAPAPTVDQGDGVPTRRPIVSITEFLNAPAGVPNGLLEEDDFDSIQYGELLREDGIEGGMSMPVNPPTQAPASKSPTTFPSESPSKSPSKSPSEAPTKAPTLTSTPTITSDSPSKAPTTSPTNSPSTSTPTTSPTRSPIAPTDQPTIPPTTSPTSQQPSLMPVNLGPPTLAPTPQPLFCNPPLTSLLRETILFTEIATISNAIDILTSGTPQNQAFEWLLNVDPAQVCPGETLNVVQRYVLAVLFYSTGGEDWDECGDNASCPGTPYLSGSNICFWFNTVCDGPNGNLIEIRLDQNNLVGELPDELSALERLERLNFDDNGSLFGAIPGTLGDLNLLEDLDIGSNMFSGVLPVQLFSATNLVRIVIDNNDITGPIPPAIGNLQDLENLQLDSNMLTGTLEPRIGELSLLRFLTLNNNDIEGPIPTSFANLGNLRAFAAQSNGLNGTIPAFMGSLDMLRTINFFDNFLTGDVPSELGLLTNLQNLFLHFNPLTGSMPPEICALRAGELQQLVSDCGPGGTIECEQPTCCTACFTRPPVMS